MLSSHIFVVVCDMIHLFYYVSAWFILFCRLIQSRLVCRLKIFVRQSQHIFHNTFYSKTPSLFTAKRILMFTWLVLTFFLSFFHFFSPSWCYLYELTGGPHYTSVPNAIKRVSQLSSSSTSLCIITDNIRRDRPSSVFSLNLFLFVSGALPFVLLITFPLTDHRRRRCCKIVSWFPSDW